MSEMRDGPAPGAPVPPDQTTPKHDDKPKTAWFVGVLLIALGVIFLLENFGYVFTENWWALFIYLAAAATFVNMWREWRAVGWFNSKAAGSLTFGLVLTTVASIFLFNLLWDVWWPLVLVAIGGGIVIGWILGDATGSHRT